MTMEKIYFCANHTDWKLEQLWQSGMHETPQEAATAYFESLRDEKHPQNEQRLKALRAGCDKGIIEIKAYFNRAGSRYYTLSNFGPVYTLASHLAEDGRYLPGKGTTHEMINSETVRRQEV